MALSIDEKKALLELKNQGYSYDEAVGFIATSRTGNGSRVEQKLNAPEPTDDSAQNDLKTGFQGAVAAFDQGFKNQTEVERRPSLAGRVSGTLGQGFKAAGGAVSSVLGGAIRAVPGGTTVMNTVEDITGKAVEKTVQTETYKGANAAFNKLPQGVQQTLGDVGNVALGALSIAEPLVVPGTGKALNQGIKAFANSGVTETGQSGIQTAVRTGLEPEAIMQRVARISKGKQAAFEERAGESVGEYLVNRGIFGDPEAITEQLYQRMQTSKGRVDTGLARVGGLYKNDTVQDALEQLAEREARVSSSRTPSKDTARVNELLSKNSREGLSLTEINEVKRLYERNIKVDYLRDNVSDGIARATNIDNNLRTFVETAADKAGFPTVKSLNKETALAKQLLDDLGAEYAGQQGNNFVSLSDALFLAEAASNPSALAAFGLKKAFSSKSAMSAVAKLIANKKTNKGLPSGDFTEPNLLSAPEPGAPRSQTSGGPTMRVSPNGDVTPPEDRLIETTRPGAIQRSDSEPVPTATEAALARDNMAVEQAIMEIEVETLERPRGSSNLAYNAEGEKYRFRMLPAWIPKDLRDGALLDRVMQNIIEGKAPRANATNEIALQEIVEEQISARIKQIKETAPNTGVFSDDIAFAAALMAGGAYYLYADDGEIASVVAIGSLLANPKAAKLALRSLDEQRKMLEGTIKKLEDANQTKSNKYKQAVKAHNQLMIEYGRLQKAAGKDKGATPAPNS